VHVSDPLTEKLLRGLGRQVKNTWDFDIKLLHGNTVQGAYENYCTVIWL
jgi:hypothetical protein